MAVRSWLASLFRAPNRRPSRRPARLDVESLEGRVQPSTFTTLSTFASYVSGASPEAGLVSDGSGNLFGTTYAGGAYSLGTVFEVAAGGSLTALATFNGTNGAYPQGDLVRDGSGNLFGTTLKGGASNLGTVFEIVAGSNTVTTLATFNGTNGSLPAAGLVRDGSGNLFGTTQLGGASNLGTVFEVVAGSGTVKTLASFNGTNGDLPLGGLVRDGSGNLFGTTKLGGPLFGPGGNGSGTVFEVAAGSGALTTLASFNGTNGADPEAGLVRDGSGNLFGTTTGGGASNLGTVFEVVAGSGAVTTLATFNGTNGDNSVADLVRDGSGNLFGTTSAGGASNLGTVFEVAAGSGTITTLASFDFTNGSLSEAGLVRDGNGNLFGTTAEGGTTNNGTVFEIAAGSGSVTTLVNFSGLSAAGPLGGLVKDSSGNLFGTTGFGGTGYDVGLTSLGTMYEVAAVTGAVTTLASFQGIDGNQPFGSLVRDGSGNLFGTTSAGGASNLGTVFEVAAGSGAITTLASFNGTNGSEPRNGLVMDGSGNLFGTTYNGGAHGYGTLFEIVAGSGAITTLASFNGTSTGGLPSGDLLMDGSGNLFGTAEIGGAYGDGTVFEVVAGSGTITTLATFTGTNGANPLGGLVRDSRGNLFGTTDAGGASNDGTVFEVVAGSGTITTLATFNGTNGANPQFDLVMDGSGNLFGTTFLGGASNAGTLFEVAAGSGALTTLVTFNGTNGADPVCTLVMDGSGNLFGTTEYGGAFGIGTLFELAGAATPTASPTVTKVTDAGGTYDGTTALAASAIVTGAGTITGSATLDYFDNTTGTDLGSSAPVNAGHYTVTATYAGDATHTGSSATATFDVFKAASTTKATGGSFVYDGTTHAGGSAVVSGVGTGITQTVVLTYSGDRVHATPGSYTVTATYAGDANHLGSSDSATITITKASSTTTTAGAGPFTYDGTTHGGGSGAVTGAGGLSTGATSLTYTGDQVDAGTYYVTAHYAGDANHLPSDGAAVAISIQKAASSTTTVGAGPFTYDGTTHGGGSGTVTGAGGLSTGATSLTYTGDRIDAGTYYVTAHYAGDANHLASDGTAVAVTIKQATLPVVVTSDRMLAGSTPPSLTGTVNGNAFTGSTAFKTAQGDTLTVTLGSSVQANSPVGVYSIVATVTGAASANYVQPTSGNIYVVTTAGQIKVSRSGLTHRPGTDLYAQVLTLTDTGSALTGGFAVEFTGIASGMSLAGASYIDGSGHLTGLVVTTLADGTTMVLLPASLAPSLGTGQSLRLSLTWQIDGAAFAYGAQLDQDNA